MGEVTSLAKSVFPRTRQGFSYGYGEGFRDQNTPNLDNGALKANEGFEPSEQRDVIGIIDIHVDDLLISGSDMFAEYITQKMTENSKRIAMGGMKRSIYGRKSLK